MTTAATASGTDASPSNPTMLAYTSRAPHLPPAHLFSDVVFKPKLLPNQVLIKISHASLTPGGVIMQAIVPGFLHTYPSIPELDFAGKIVEIGADVKQGENAEFKKDDLVFGSVPVTQHLKGAGALAEYVAVAASQIAHVPTMHSHAPATVDYQMAVASSLPVSGCTAVALFNAAKLRPGMNVCVNGASGGIGTLILQLAQHAVGYTGRVTAVCSQKNVQLVKGLGADEVVAYDAHVLPVVVYLLGVCNQRARVLAIDAGKTLTDDGVSELSKEEVEAGKFDVVIDAVGKQEIWRGCTTFLKQKGAYVTVGPSMEAWTRGALLKTLVQMAHNILTPKLLGGVGRRYIQVASTVDKKQLLELKRLVEEGSLKGVVERIWEWDQIGQAYDVMLSRRARGKIVIRIGQRLQLHTVDNS